MGAAETTYEETGEEVTVGERLEVAPQTVEVSRNGAVAGALGVVAAAVAIAYLARATQSGGVLDWVFAVGMGAVAVAWLGSLLDSRTPLLVADVHGVRVRLGRSWHGLPWSAVREVEHQPRRGVLRDGRLVVHPHNIERFESELDAAGRRQVRLARALHGAPLALPLGLTTRVQGAEGDLSEALRAVAADAGRVVVVEPQAPEETEDLAAGAAPEAVDAPTTHLDAVDLDAEVADVAPALDHDEALEEPAPGRVRAWLLGITERLDAARTRPAEADDLDEHADLLDEHLLDAEDADATRAWSPDELADAVAEDEQDLADEDVEPGPSPVRDLRSARRSEVRVVIDDLEDDELQGRELHRRGSVDLVEETRAWGDRVRPIAREGDAVEPLVIDDFSVEPAEDPVVGPDLAAARTRLGLSVDQLADRTRIRPHVIESIEVDDFAPCGGDFYARGHLRTLARVLGIDAAPLLTAYDERYANAPVNPRRVFEAELATGANGSIRGTRGGPNWSVLVAAVMAVVLCWSVARLVMDSPADIRPDQPVLNGSGGPDGTGRTSAAKPVDVTVAAPGGGAHVVVRDSGGKIVFKGSLTAGSSKDLKVSPPVRVQSSDGAVTVALGKADPRPVGDAGVAGQSTFVVR